MLSTKLKEAAGNGADATLYVDDVFSTYLYTGNGSTQTITNGIDLAGKGGLVWIKGRSVATGNRLASTAQGVNNYLESNSTMQQQSDPLVTSFNANGFSLGIDSNANGGGTTFASWTFRKAAKFFDVVTYTGDGTSSKIINHNLGCMPGMIIVKTTASSADWVVCNRIHDTNYLGRYATYNYALNTTGVPGAGIDPALRGITTTSFDAAKLSGINASYEINIGNASGQTYVAYLFAHDTSSTGIIQCGGFTFANNGTLGTSVSLGWEPQYVLIKNVDGSNDQWKIYDTMRGMAVNPSNGSAGIALYANLSAAEVTTESTIFPNSTGFTAAAGSLNVGVTYTYMAIRRPNKPPTTGTQVYKPVVTPSSGAVQTIDATFPSDMVINCFRDIADGCFWFDRLRGYGNGGSPTIKSFNTDAEVTNTYIYAGSQTTVTQAGTAYGYSEIEWFFKRAPGFFDEVCYTGTGVAATQAHNLGVVPEMMIVKARSVAGSNWGVYVSSLGNTQALLLNLTNVPAVASNIWNNTSPTSSVFTIGTAGGVNASGTTYVAYLFATLAGISKVGSYTGNGTGQAIACGFSAGARFVLIKRTDSTGDWYTFDSARGLTSGSSPYLLLNSTAAEVTGNNGVYASTGGFTLGSTASTTTNINAATYIFLAVA